MCLSRPAYSTGKSDQIGYSYERYPGRAAVKLPKANVFCALIPSVGEILDFLGYDEDDS